MRPEVEQWRHEGWALIEGAVHPDEVAAALAEIAPRSDTPQQPAGPTRRADQVNEPRFRARQFDGTVLFPYPNAPRLNRLVVHPSMVDFAAEALETDDLRVYQSRVWSKYGDHTNYEQPFHVDGNHSLLPIRQGPGWGHVEFFLYLHDVDESNGAPRLVPGAIAGRNDLGIGDGLGGAGTTTGPISADEGPHLYGAEISASARAGSLLAYRSDVWHRGVDIETGAERHILVVSMRPGHVEWIGFDAHAPLVNSLDFVRFAEACTPAELALFGVPKPGHEFWTHDVVDATQRIYPGLDLTPWRERL